MVKRNGMWLAVILVSILALGVALLAGMRSAVGRAFDLAEYKAASPYYQTLALREQVEGGRGNGVLWVLGGILLVILAGWLLAQATPFLRESRLSYKAMTKQDAQTRRAARRPQYVDSLPNLPPTRMLRLLPDGRQAETVEYDEVDGLDDGEGHGRSRTGYWR